MSSLIVFNVIAGPFASLTCLSVLTIRMMFRTLNGLIMGVFERFVFIVLFHIINDVFKKGVHPNIIRPTIILAIFHLPHYQSLDISIMNVFRFEINISDTKSSLINVLNTNVTCSWKTGCKNTNRFRVTLKDVHYFLGYFMVFFGQLCSLKTTVDDVPQKKSWIWSNMRVSK